MSTLLPSAVLQLTTGFVHTVVNAATATGTAKSIPFAIQQRTLGTKRTVGYDVTGTFSVGTVQLQKSVDQGATFQNVGAALDIAANKAGDLGEAIPEADWTPGSIYQFDIATITGTSITIKLTIS